MKLTAWRRSGRPTRTLLVHVSTQNLSGIAPQVAEPLGIPAGNIQVLQQYVGGGFGSKFSPDRWGIATAQLSKAAGGKPVKIMLERDCRAGSRGHASLVLRARQGRRRQRRQARRLGIALLGNGRNGWRRHASAAVHLRDSQSAQAEHRHRHQSGKRARVACAESSAGCGHHHGALSKISRPR